MNLDFTPFFAEYEKLVAQVDAVFAKVAAEFSAEVTCRQGCSDCCHALFDITLIEALYLNARFADLSEAVRGELLIEADKADRKAQILKKKVSREAEKTEHSELLLRAAQERLRCPLLGVEDSCVLYGARPITCRLYGLPLEIGGQGHTCGISGFEPGRAYPTVKMERIQDMLLALSNQVLDALGSRYSDFRLMHVPVSTAIMTVYTPDFFGLNDSLPKPATTLESGDA